MKITSNSLRVQSMLLLSALLLLTLLASCSGQAPLPTATPTPPPTPTPTPAPTLPDAQADAEAALLYSSTPGVFNSAEFTYDMTVVLEPADQESSAALGDDVIAALSAASFSGRGEGAIEVVDAQAGEANMRMDMALQASGQELSFQMVLAEGRAWLRTQGQEAWQETEVSQAVSALPGGIGPNALLQSFGQAVEAEWVEDTALNSEPVRHLRFRLDPAALDLFAVVASIGVPQEEVAAILEESSIAADAWLGANDLIPRRQAVQISFLLPSAVFNLPNATLRMVIGMVMNFDQINQPVTIEIPAGG